MGDSNTKAMEEGQKNSPASSTEKTTTTEVASKYSVPSTLSNIIKILPTGVLFVYQAFSNLISTNENTCGKWNKIFVGVFLGILAVACFILSLTDTFTDDSTGKAKVHYGIATRKGIATISGSKNKVKPSNEEERKLRPKGLLYAIVAVVVFAVLSLTDKNVVMCLYPSAEANIKMLLQALPLVVSVVSGVIFAVFPSKRQGISHPVTAK